MTSVMFRKVGSKVLVLEPRAPNFGFCFAMSCTEVKCGASCWWLNKLWVMTAGTSINWPHLGSAQWKPSSPCECVTWGQLGTDGMQSFPEWAAVRGFVMWWLFSDEGSMWSVDLVSLWEQLRPHYQQLRPRAPCPALGSLLHISPSSLIVDVATASALVASELLSAETSRRQFFSCRLFPHHNKLLPLVIWRLGAGSFPYRQT